jgi:hypothetical protein
MTEAQLSEEISSTPAGEAAHELHSEDHLALRCMFLKDYDLLDIDHGHFWYKLSWHGVHVEFPSPQHHYEANPHERVIRDHLLSLPVGDLEETFKVLQDQPEAELDSGDHHFRFVWDQEIHPHLHCYYQRSVLGRRHDSDAYQRRLQDHAHRYESNRQFPSQRLMQKLAWLREERAKAQKSVDAWQRLIVQLEEQIALDQIVHTGRVEESSFA